MIDLGAAEGDKRFARIRAKILNSVNSSLADSVAELQSKGRVDKDLSPAAIAGSLVAMLAAVASHQKGASAGASSRPNCGPASPCWCTSASPDKPTR
ncbi:TetR family transcriptional regulator OS=Streptomyces fumanus OX=67302 GN=GCM10018772_31180 PE=4 SV=1 [Streptomyces fumanus]